MHDRQVQNLHSAALHPGRSRRAREVAGRALLDGRNQSCVPRSDRRAPQSGSRRGTSRPLMPSTSHRRCQYQGEGCMGTAHAGHDQCAHCYFTYIKPQITEERQRVKGRRALKRRLSAENRQLISEVDLKEPLPRIPDSIRNAIFDIELDRLIENKTPEEASDAVTHELQKIWTDVPVVMDRLPQKEEPPVQETVPEPTPLTRHP